MEAARIASSRKHSAARLWTSFYVTLVTVIIGAKFYGLLAAGEVWRDNMPYTAAAAASSSYLEVLVAALISASHGAVWLLARSRPVRSATLISAVACAVLMTLINLVNAELLPYYGAPLSLDLIHSSNVFETEHGRSAVLGWVSPDAWGLVAILLLAPAVGYALGVALGRRLGTIPLVVIAAVASVAIVAAGLLLGPTPDAFARSGTHHLLTSVRLLGADVIGRGNVDVPPLPSELVEPAVSLRTAAERPPFRNVIMIVLESVAASYLDQYGGKLGLTPNLTALTHQSVIVSDAYAQAVSSTRSMGVLLSSRYPAISQRKLPSVPAQAYGALPRLLRGHGVRTAFFHSSDTRFDQTDRFLLAAGFDAVRDFRGRSCDVPLLDDGWGALATPDRCTFDELRGWIRSAPGRPFFATLWTFQTHYPYYPGDRKIPAQLAGEAPNRRILEQKRGYLSAIAEADRLIGVLVAGLKTDSLYEDTLVIVTADHGEAFGARGTYGHRTLYEDVIRVPLILINPKLRSTPRLERLAGHIDLAPTVADALGIAAPASWNGKSLFRPRPEAPIYFAALWVEPSIGYRFRNRKVIHRLNSGDTQLFDVSRDPGEVDNLARRWTEPQLRTEQHRLFNWARSVNAAWQADRTASERQWSDRGTRTNAPSR